MELSNEQFGEIAQRIFWMMQWEQRREQELDNQEVHLRFQFKFQMGKSPSVEERSNLEKQIVEMKIKVADEFEHYKPYQWEVPEPFRKVFDFQ